MEATLFWSHTNLMGSAGNIHSLALLAEVNPSVDTEDAEMEVLLEELDPSIDTNLGLRSNLSCHDICNGTVAQTIHLESLNAPTSRSVCMCILLAATDSR